MSEKCKRIRLLVDTAYNDKGDIVTVQNEDDKYYYYEDGCQRWTYIEKALTEVTQEGVIRGNKR